MRTSVIMRFTFLIPLCAFFALIMGGRSDKGPPSEDTIFTHQDALIHFDTETLLTCINEDWVESARTVLERTIGDTGFSVSSFINVAKTIMPMLPLLSDGANDKSDIPSVSFTILQGDVEGNEATIALSGILIWRKVIEPFAASVALRLENDKWQLLVFANRR